MTTATNPVTTTTTLPSATPTTVPAFSMETCGGIITDVNEQPNVSLEGLLLTADDAPAGYTTPGPMTTGSAGPQFSASVPSIVPAYWIHFAAPASNAQGAAGGSYLSETLGQVASPDEAAQWVTRITAAEQLPQCLYSGQATALGGSVPSLTVVESAGGSRAGSLNEYTVLAAKGPYVVNIMWGTSTTSQAGAPPLPSLTELAALVDQALALVPG
jgi:hypothetical protein